MSDAELLAEATAWRDRLHGRKGWRILGALIERLQDVTFQRDALLLAIRSHRDSSGDARKKAEKVLSTFVEIIDGSQKIMLRNNNGMDSMGRGKEKE